LLERTLRIRLWIGAVVPKASIAVETFAGFDLQTQNAFARNDDNKVNFSGYLLSMLGYIQRVKGNPIYCKRVVCSAILRPKPFMAMETFHWRSFLRRGAAMPLNTTSPPTAEIHHVLRKSRQILSI